MSNRREDLTFRWGIDADAFRRQLTRINADVQKSTDGIKGRLAEAFTISAAAYALKNIGEQMVELRRKAEDFGYSVEGLQVIEALGAKFGGSAEQVDAALQKLTLAVGNARTEGGAAAESFERFGISLYDTNGAALSTEAVFAKIADAYSNSSDAATKAALAFEFFGRTGKDINNILELGSSGLSETAEKMKTLGTVSKESTDAIADAWLSLKGSVGGVSGFLKNRLGDVLSAFTIGRDIAVGLSKGMSRKEAMNFAQNEYLGLDSGTSGGTWAQDVRQRRVKDAAEIAKLMQARITLGEAVLSDEGKIAAVSQQQAEIKRRLNGMEAGTLEYVKLENELIAKGTELQRLQLNVQREKAAEAQKLNELEQKRSDILKEVAEKRAGKLFLSREELRNVNLDTVNPQKRAQFESQQKAEAEIRGLETLSEAHRLAGNFEYARRLNLFIERRLAALTLVKEEERDPFLAQRKAFAALGPGGLPGGAGGVAVAGNVARALAAGQPVAGVGPDGAMLAEMSEIRRLLKVGEAKMRVHLAP